MPASEPTVFDFSEVLSLALDEGGNTHTLEDIHKAVLRGDMQLWPGVTSAMVTQIEDTPRQRILHIALAGGTLNELEAMLPALVEYGKHHFCTMMTLSGRRGWSKIPQTRNVPGWRTTGVTMMCPLTLSLPDEPNH
jgi:hypothetical protein